MTLRPERSNILLFCPTKRLEPETVAAIFAQEWDGALHFLFTRDNPHGDAKMDILHNYRAGRAAFLQGDYDAMFIVESDIIPPPGALRKLSRLDADVALGLYCFRHGRPVWNAYRKVVNETGCPDQSYSIFPDQMEQVWGQAIEVSGAGLGCALIWRHVLEQISFRECGQTHCDWCFTCDVIRAGYKQMCDLSVVCGHKRPDGTVIWPAPWGWEFT